MRFITLIYRNVTRRPIRSALTICGMAIAVAAVVALVGIADSFQRSLLDLYQGQGVDIVVVRSRSIDRMASDLDQGLAEKISALPGVTSAEPVLFDTISFVDEGLYGIVVQGVTPPAVKARKQTVLAGRLLEPGDGRVVLLGETLARNLGKQVGDEVEVYEGEPFEVVGIYDRHNILENGSLLLPLAQLQALLGQAGRISACNIRLAEPWTAQDIRQTVSAIEQLGPGLSAAATEDYVQTDSKIRVSTAMAWSTSALALILGGIGVLNTMIVSVFERTSEIGVLRAIGWRKPRIIRMILCESGLLSLCGATLGTLLALGMTFALSRTPAASSLVGPRIAGHVVVQGFAIALLIGLLGAIGPAVRAARLTPSVALRNEG
ncbi:MAG: ABC transporter permease [Planctomycetaceae bacterium]|nr:ABC transporter permease [Planctomycetaceae bacterium]